MSNILIAPYLPVSQSARVGSWELIPFRRLEASGFASDQLMRPASRLIEAYRLQHAGPPLGVVAVPESGRVGSPFDRALMPRLGHALLAGVVAGNPTMAIAEDDEEPNAGWAVCTSENALLYGHPLIESDSYAVETGVLARVNAIRHAPGDEPLPKIEPPVELPKPLFAHFDEEIANATYALLSTGESAARRLHRALDWYRIALSNAEAVTLDLRVGAARSALEVLTGAGEETKRLVRAYGRLTREESTTTATYDEVFWAKGAVALTPDEWWLTRLCVLRNTIVHGDKITDELWEHEGHHQLNHIHDRLIAALRIVVAEQFGDPLLRLTQSDRLFPRIAQQAARHLQQSAEETPDPGSEESL
jgi:hypothetical protein